MRFNGFIKATDEYCTRERPVPAPILRRSFDIRFRPVKARLMITASGFYRLFVNGKDITRGLLSPFIQNPDHVLWYDMYDLSEYLVKGRNAVAVILGNGFANQDLPAWEFDRAPFRAPLCMALELSVRGLGGKSYSLSGDISFRVHPSALQFDMYRLGTVYDARLETAGFSEPDFDDSDWGYAKRAVPPHGAIRPSVAAPIRVTEEIPPSNITKQSELWYFYKDEKTPVACSYTSGGYLYDFGKNGAGVCRLRIRGERGQKVTLRHGESLRFGDFNMNTTLIYSREAESYLPLWQADTYTLRGGDEEIFIPPFTYHGFRYVFVEGITKEQATPDLLTALHFHTDIPRRATFDCSSSALCRLYEMGVRSDESNFHHFPTDCPQREKNGWTGDIAVSAHQLFMHYACADNMEMWLTDMRASQTPEGQVPGIVPTSGWGYEWGCGPMWDSAIINVPYYAVRYDGRIDIVRDNATLMYRYLRYIAGKRMADGLVACGLGDWCQPVEPGLEISAPLELTDSLTVLDMARKAAVLFRMIEKNGMAGFAEKLADEMYDAIRRFLIRKTDMTAYGKCQTSQALALRYGLFTKEEYPEAYRRLIEYIHKKGDHLDCGMIGLRHIFHVLFAGGDADLALEMIARPDAPSYGNMILLGGTTLFEATRQNGVQTSQNHHFYGDILHLFVSKLAGLHINPHMDDPYFVFIEPTVPRSISYAEASYTFADGSRATVAWKKTDEGELSVRIHLPDAACGEFHYADTVRQLLPGDLSLLLPLA